jgi:hypothetical protein
MYYRQILIGLSLLKNAYKTLKKIQQRSIIVFHDSTKVSKKRRFVLAKILKEFTEKGFIF